MITSKTCPACGGSVPADAPHGLCPSCLAKSALEHLLAPLASPPAPEPGRFGDYEVLEEIARGGMGIVYRARQLSSDRLVAIKMLLAGHLASEAEVQRFCAESEAAASLHHPNIVEVYEAGEIDGQLFYSMRLVEGESLAQRISHGRRPFSNAVAARLMAKVARAVHHAHQRGILHRDIKPGNILLDSAGEPHVTDFGLARQVAKPSDLTLTGMVLGSPSYMSPEQASGESRTLTTATDIYSLGAVLYALLTGQPPFSGETHLDTVRKLLDREPATPRTLDSHVDRDLETICLKCLEKRAQDRYGSAEAVAEDLDRWIRGEPILARPVTAGEKLLKWARRKPALAAMTAVACLAVLAGLAGVLSAWRTAETARRVAVEDRERVREAKDDATEKLRDSYLAQAHANRLTSEPGRRFRSLEILAKAAAIRPGGDLRDEAIAAMACIDMHTLSTNRFEESGTAAAPDDSFTLFGMELPGGGISLRRLESGEEMRRIPAQDLSFLFPLSHGGRWVAARCKDLRARLWDTRSGDLVLTQPVAKFVQSLAFRPDDQRVALCDGKRRVQIHEIPSGRLVVSIPLETAPELVAYSPNGAALAVTEHNGRITIWDAETGQAARCFVNASPLSGLAWHPDNRRLATTDHNRRVVIWDTVTGEAVRSLIGHGEEVHHVAFHPCGELLLSSGWDGIMLWRIQTGERLMALPDTCGLVKFSSDGRRLFGKLYRARDFILGEFAYGSPVLDYGSAVPSNKSRTAVFSPKGDLLAYLDHDHLRWFETRSGHELTNWERGDLQDLSFDWSSNFWTWTTRSAERQALRPGAAAGEWRLDPPEPLPPYTEGKLKGASPDGRFFVLIKGQTMTLLSTEPLRELTALTPAAEGMCASLNPEADRMCIGAWHNDKLWFLEKGATGQMALQHTLTNPAGFCGSPRFSSDGRQVAIHWGTSLAMLDTTNRTQLWSLPLDDLPVYALAPKGGLLAVRTGKRHVQLVAADSGSVLATLSNPNGMPVRQLLFSGDAERLAVVSDGLSQMYVWDLRELRRDLARLGLDWPQPPMPALLPPDPEPIRLRVSTNTSLASPATASVPTPHQN